MKTSPLSLSPVPEGSVRLLGGLFRDRFELNSRYVADLREEYLLQNHYLEAGLRRPMVGITNQLGAGEHAGGAFPGHSGWEFPTCQVRGHFLGHWLSAAARIARQVDDRVLKARADHVVSELASCQERNGGEWCGPIPEKNLEWAANGASVWAPQYVLHKTLMGLFDMFRYAGNEQALEIMVRWAEWFHRWTGRFSRDEMDELLDVETGGMLEVWADLYSVTGDAKHLELLQRYDRRRLFDRLLAGDDVLTNQHANTTIPEVHGAARAWEVTGEQRWREIVEAYWRLAVTDRGFFCTGGQTCGEVWTPPFEFSARLGDKNQEHCTTYNMMRLADYLLRWTGDAAYADYWERNLYNGTLAQQNPDTGMVAYFLPLRAGAVKRWGTPTQTFWCCHGSLVQAHTQYAGAVWFENDDGLTVSQYIPSELDWTYRDTPVRAVLRETPQQNIKNPCAPPAPAHRPDCMELEIAIDCETPVEFSLDLRLPWWLAGNASFEVGGETTDVPERSGWHRIRRRWHRDTVRLRLPRAVHASPLPDRPETVAFLEGPVVLGGLCGGRSLVHADRDNPAGTLVPDNEREWAEWKCGYRAQRQPEEILFRPLYDITDERYTVYFPMSP